MGSDRRFASVGSVVRDVAGGIGDWKVDADDLREDLRDRPEEVTSLANDVTDVLAGLLNGRNEFRDVLPDMRCLGTAGSGCLERSIVLDVRHELARSDSSVTSSRDLEGFLPRGMGLSGLSKVWVSGFVDGDS